MPKKILVVDDDCDLLDLLSFSLNAAGFLTATAATGPDGIEKARTFLPDLILLDVVMPEMDGFAVCEKLRRDPATASVPIIMLTAMPGELPRFVGIDSGANEYFHKPFETEQLVARVQACLDHPAAPNQQGNAA